MNSALPVLPFFVSLDVVYSCTMAEVSSPPTPPARVVRAVPGAPVKPPQTWPQRPVPRRPDQRLYAPPMRPSRPVQPTVLPPSPRVILKLNPVRRKLFELKCEVCKRDADPRTVLQVTVLERPDDKLEVCPRCAVCKECGTMRPGPDGKQEEHVLDGAWVMHRRCMRCVYCGKTGVDHATKRKHVGCSRKHARLPKQ